MSFIQTECPNCGAVWSFEEMDWGCGCCGYPNNDEDFNDDIEDGFGDDDYTENSPHN